MGILNLTRRRVYSLYRDVRKFFRGNYSRALTGFFIFINTPKKEEEIHQQILSPSEQWFGLKAYTLSSTPVIRLLGWAAVVTLSLAIFLIACITVSRLFTLWDLWFEAIRRPDRESSVERFLRILSFWLIVAGIASWILCALLG